ncbi:putative membrane protein [Synechococcus sp. TAK9802]|nr:putative membrane protein [Synechococcus sp. TAK9802]
MIKESTTTNPNQMGIIPLTPRSIRNLLIAVTGGLLVAHSVVQMGIYGFGAKKYWLDSLNMDRELNLPTLFSSALLLIAALLMRRLGQSSDRIASHDWRLLSKIFIFLALDEALQIHEILIIPGLRHQVHPALASTWVVPYAVLALILLWRFRRFLGSISRATASRLLRAGAVYIGGAIGMEMIGSFAVRSNLIRLHSPWYGAITGLEEALELVGIILLIDALLRALLDQRNSLDLTLRLGPDSDSN